MAKPHFGITNDSDKAQQPVKKSSDNKSEMVSTTSEIEAQQDSNATKSSTPKFGISEEGAAKQKSDTTTVSDIQLPHLGIDNHHTRQTKHSLTDIFKLKSRTFWLLSIIFSIIFFAFAKTNNSQRYALIRLIPSSMRMLNLILFPFARALMEEFGTKKVNSTSIAYLIFGSEKGKTSDMGCATIFIWAIRIVMLFVTWSFSFILGFVALITMSKQTAYKED